MQARKTYVLAIVLTAMTCGGARAAYLSAPSGYSAQDTVFAVPAGEYVAGFDLLPNGNFVAFSGSRIVEVNNTGGVSTLYTFGSSVFGSFVKVRNGHVYFGESSNGSIMRMALDGSNPQVIGTVAYNFDMEFNSLGQAFVSANPDFLGCKIYLLDTQSGATDLIASLTGPTGPLAFDGADNLLYGTVSSNWGEQGGQSVVRFSAAQVSGAVGEGNLALGDGEALASDVDSLYDMESDGWGNTFFTSTVSTPSTLWRLSSGSVSSFATATPGTYHYLSTLRYNPANSGLSVLVGGVTDDGGNSLGVISTVLPVPEPDALISLTTLASLAGTALLRRRRSG